MSNILEGPNPDEMKAGETYRVVYRGETRIGEKRLELEKVEGDEAEQEFTPKMYERGSGAEKCIMWSNIKLGEITDERLARNLKATHSNPVCLCFSDTMRDGKLVLEVYGDDVPDDFKC